MSNDSLISSITHSTSAMHIAFNLISFVATLIGTSVSFTMLIGVLLRRRHFSHTPSILCINNYVLVFVFGICELIQNITILQADFKFIVVEKETMMCRIIAYIEFSLVFAVYCSCTLQAIFRLGRIMYSSQSRVLNSQTCLVIIPLLWIVSFVLVSPLFFWHSHKLIPNEYTCRITKTDSLGIAYATLVVYGIPFVILALVYFQVHQFLRRQAATNSLVLRSRSNHRQRDILVFRRIIIVVLLLGSYGVPNSVMLMILAFTGKLVTSFYRILGMSFSSCVLTLSIALVYVDPHLRGEIRLYRSKNSAIAIVNQEGCVIRQIPSSRQSTRNKTSV